MMALVYPEVFFPLQLEGGASDAAEMDYVTPICTQLSSQKLTLVMIIMIITTLMIMMIKIIIIKLAGSHLHPAILQKTDTRDHHNDHDDHEDHDDHYNNDDNDDHPDLDDHDDHDNYDGQNH